MDIYMDSHRLLVLVVENAVVLLAWLMLVALREWLVPRITQIQ